MRPFEPLSFALLLPVDAPIANSQSDQADDNSLVHTGDQILVAHVAVLKPMLGVDDKMMALTSGVAATAESKRGSRGVIDSLLSPLSKASNVSARERQKKSGTCKGAPPLSEGAR